ncbi:hypothetical protein [Erysipelothrix sp. P66]|uniref:hypothetical protein n=1 Tax=Erysipelothrix sp. P66 TaxID=3141531 RepID=UPI00315C4BDC
MKSILAELDNEDISIESKKKIGKAFKEARINSKKFTCMLCDEEVSSFCNSHSIPQFVLKSIADNGKIITTNNFIKFDFFDIEVGLNNTGVFHNICNKCDSTFFRDYEDVEQISREITQKMMAQISVKNMLQNLHKRNVEKKLFEQHIFQFEEHGPIVSIINKLKEIELDLHEINNDFVRSKKAVEQNSPRFTKIYETRLPYVVPIASQVSVALVFDLDGKIINDVFSHDPSTMMKSIQIAVYPQDNYSIILLFIENINRFRYKSFLNQFQKYSNEEKLHLISNILITYVEDVYFSPKIESSLLKNEYLKKMARTSTDIISNSIIIPDREFYNDLYQMFSIISNFNTPNLLSEKYSIYR